MSVGTVRKEYEIEEMIRSVGRPKEEVKNRTVLIFVDAGESPLFTLLCRENHTK